MKKVFTKILAIMILLSVATLTMSSACSRDDDDITNNSSNSRRNPTYNIITWDGNTYYANYDEDYLAYFYIHGYENGVTSKEYDWDMMDRIINSGNFSYVRDNSIFFLIYTWDGNPEGDRSTPGPQFYFEYTYNHSTPRVGDDLASFPHFKFSKTPTGIFVTSCEGEYISGSAKVTKISNLENSRYTTLLTIVFDHLTMRCYESGHGEHVLNGKAVVAFDFDEFN